MQSVAVALGSKVLVSLAGAKKTQDDFLGAAQVYSYS